MIAPFEEVGEGLSRKTRMRVTPPQYRPFGCIVPKIKLFFAHTYATRAPTPQTKMKTHFFSSQNIKKGRIKTSEIWKKKEKVRSKQRTLCCYHTEWTNFGLLSSSDSRFKSTTCRGKASSQYSSAWNNFCRTDNAKATQKCRDKGEVYEVNFWSHWQPKADAPGRQEANAEDSPIPWEQQLLDCGGRRKPYLFKQCQSGPKQKEGYREFTQKWSKKNCRQCSFKKRHFSESS